MVEFKILFISLWIITIFTLSWTKVVSERVKLINKNYLDTIKEQQLQQQHKQKEDSVLQHNNVNYTEAYEQIHHKSYDKNNDVGTSELAIMGRHNNDAIVSMRRKRELSDWLIAPNTRWCGRGNTANGTWNHLGGASAADKCCRKHDHCHSYIPAMSSRYDLFNYRPYTISHCNCDRRFRTCLKISNDEDAKTIGKLFFNIVKMECFALRVEKVCQRRAADGTCELIQTKHKAFLRTNKKF